MQRRARQHGPKDLPSTMHLAYLSRVRLPLGQHPSSPSPRKPQPRSNVPPGRRGFPSLPFPRSTAPSRARYRHAPCPPHRNESDLQRIPSGPCHQIRRRDMAIAQKGKPREDVKLPGSFARREQPYSAPLLLDHPDPYPRESQREISLFAPPLLSSGIPESRGKAERKWIPVRVPGSDPKPSALWPRLPSWSAERHSCKRPWVHAD